MGRAPAARSEETWVARVAYWALILIGVAAGGAYQRQHTPQVRPLGPIGGDPTLPAYLPEDAQGPIEQSRRAGGRPAPQQMPPARPPGGAGGEAVAAAPPVQPPPVISTPPARPQRPAGAAAPAPEPPPEVAFEVVTAEGVDERLFLMRALETLYEGWPTAGEGRSLEAAIAALRHEATRHQLYIRERGIEDRIAGLYGDLVALLDTYADCLAEAGRIERGGASRADRERAEALTKSSFQGGIAAGEAWQDGATGGEALVAWAGLTLVGTLASEMANAPARDEAKRAAMEANVRQFVARHSEALATAEGATLALADRYGWAKGEAGFDTTPEQSRQIMDLAARGDTLGLFRLMVAARERRPRDPFVLASSASRFATALGASATLDELARSADQCLAAAALVPEGAFYDGYRSEFLAQAGLLANEAALRELGSRGCVSGPAQRGPRALSLWRAYLAADPRDPTGQVHAQLALALATTRRFAEAAAAAGEVADRLGNDPDFACSYAGLLSLTGRTADSLRWLEHAYRDCHHPDILLARSDPDLAAVRSDQAAGFAELVAVKHAWSIDWGLVSHDDICLTNNSAFPITGVTLAVTVRSTGSAPWAQTFATGRVEPGATYRWRTWVAARGRDAAGTATLTCDQQR